MITKDERKPLAKDAICSALHCPLPVIAEFDNWEESGWMLVAATRYCDKTEQATLPVVDGLVQVNKQGWFVVQVDTPALLSKMPMTNHTG